MGNELLAVQEKRTETSPSVPLRVKAELERKSQSYAETVAQGIIMSNAIKQYFGESKQAKTLEKLRQVADELGVETENRKQAPHERDSTRDYEYTVDEWREESKKQVWTNVPASVYPLAKEAELPTGYIVTNALVNWFESTTVYSEQSELVDQLYEEVVTGDATNYELSEVKNKTTVNTPQYVAEWLHENQSGRVTKYEVRKLLQNKANYSKKQANEIAKNVVKLLPRLPSVRLDTEAMAQADVDNRRIDTNDPDEYKQGMDSVYNYTGQKLRAGYAVGDYKQALKDELRELFSLEFSSQAASSGGRRRRVAAECVARIDRTQWDFDDLRSVVEDTASWKVDVWDEHADEWYIEVYSLHTRPWDDDEVEEYLSKHAKHLGLKFIPESAEAIDSVEELSIVAEYLREVSVDWDQLDPDKIASIIDSERVRVTADE